MIELRETDSTRSCRILVLMDMDSRKFRYGLAHVLLLGCVGAFIVGQGIWKPSPRNGNPVLYNGRVVPQEGLKLNPHGLVGLENDAEQDFLRIHAAMRAYNKQYGQFPTSLRHLVSYTKTWPAWQRLTMEDLSSPDASKSDEPTHTTYTKCYMWSFRAPRPDGSPKPALPKPGERDVWLVSQNAYRSNHVVYPDGSQTYRPEGYFLVLWSDGAVERVKPDDRVLVSSGRSCGGEIAFRGAAGVPAHAKPARNVEGPWL